MSGDAKILIEMAARSFLDEVPALKPLTVVVGIDLHGRGDSGPDKDCNRCAVGARIQPGGIRRNGNRRRRASGLRIYRQPVWVGRVGSREKVDRSAAAGDVQSLRYPRPTELGGKAHWVFVDGYSLRMQAAGRKHEPGDPRP